MAHTVSAPSTITIDSTPGSSVEFIVNVRAPQPGPVEISGSFVSSFNDEDAAAPITITLEKPDLVPTLAAAIADPRLSVEVGPLTFKPGSAFDYQATVTITVN